MFIFYNFIFSLILLFYLPIYLLKRKFHKGFLSRFARLKDYPQLFRPIWVHAVSLGEALSIKLLIEDLRKSLPQAQFIFTTVTPTGNKIARSIATDRDFVTYLPFDFSFVMRRFINKLNPSLLIIAETEIWPNLISILFSRHIPIIVVNGRISDSSFRGYKILKPFIKPVLNRVTVFCVQSPVDRRRLIELGVAESKIIVSGNLKFDNRSAALQAPANLRAQIGLRAEDLLFVCGSTHPQEEEVILAAYKQLLREFRNLKLLIAPRHPERCKDVASIISRAGYRAVFVSDSAPCQNCLTHPVFILDTVGELRNFYNIADIVFVGGSLVKKGGHNNLEPAILGKPVLFGPFMHNFRDIAQLFLANNAAVMVSGRDELVDAIHRLLNDTKEMEQIVLRAYEVISANRGAAQKDLNQILAVINRGE